MLKNGIISTIQEVKAANEDKISANIKYFY